MIASIALHTVAFVLHVTALVFAVGLGALEDDDKDGKMLGALVAIVAFALAFILQVIA